MNNIFTIDLEDWYQTHVLSSAINFNEWGSCDSRIDKGSDIILGLLEEHNVKATFFVLGWIAEKHPQLVRKIHSLGHEIASHGYDHKLVSEKTPEEFKKDCTTTDIPLKIIVFLEDTTSRKRKAKNSGERFLFVTFSAISDDFIDDIKQGMPD